MSNKEHDEAEEAQALPSWRGCSMKEIYRNLPEYAIQHLPAVTVSEEHTVLYELPLDNLPNNEPPHSCKGEPKWDSFHVRLPCSTESKHSFHEESNCSEMELRWTVIKEALSQSITNSQELQRAILSYNMEYKDKWDFKALHKLFENDRNKEMCQEFFKNLLPRIIRLALQMPELIQAPIPMLKQNQTHSITLSQQQVSCLLANAFLCTFPQRNTVKRKAVDTEYKIFPEINFHRLFQSTGDMIIEKIKCLLHYFRRACPNENDIGNVPTGVVTFTRRSLDDSILPDWATCRAEIGSTLLHINSTGVIEDGRGLLQVDFANKYLGGGVLGSGCVQEEIRFVIYPELIVSKLFTEFLRPTEAFFMSGCEQYSKYTGYSTTFKWTGNHEDTTPRDSSRRRMIHLVAIDALSFRTPSDQYREELMIRELNKAYTGFMYEHDTLAPGIATGNWGCGAYRGHSRLKALLQLMVCTLTDRPLVYYTFGNTILRDDVYQLYEFLKEGKVRICDLWHVLKGFYDKGLDSSELYEYIKSGFQQDPSGVGIESKEERALCINNDF